MTLSTLRSSARLNLRSIRLEVVAAQEDGLITKQEAEVILRAHALLGTLILNASSRDGS